MKALTVCQPYGFLIVHGFKTVENRKWPTSHRGPLLIHAGQSRDWLFNGLNDMHAAGLSTMIPADGFHYGAIIGQVELVDCVPFDEELAGDAFAYCWMLKNARWLVEPIRCRGQMGLWEHPAIDELRFWKQEEPSTPLPF